MSMKNVVIVSATRSPICKAGTGRFAGHRPDMLLSSILKEALARTPQIDWQTIEDVLIGCGTPEGEQGLNIARSSSLMAGIPVQVPAATISRHGASSLSAVMHAAASIQAGFGDIFVAGGVESMTRLPNGGFNPSLSPHLLSVYPEALTPMGVSAENTANKYGISRKEQDGFAALSHNKALKAWSEGLFSTEVVPIQLEQGKGADRIVLRDENPQEVQEFDLGKLPPYCMAGGTVTTGNSAVDSDAAAVVVLMSEEAAEKMGVSPLARIRGYALAGCAPELPVQAAVTSSKRALERAELSLDQVDVFEINERHAASAISCIKQLDIHDISRVNPHGGSIALGYSTGAEGARMLVTLTHALQQRQQQFGLLTMGVFGGQGEALVIERQS